MQRVSSLRAPRLARAAVVSAAVALLAGVNLPSYSYAMELGFSGRGSAQVAALEEQVAEAQTPEVAFVQGSLPHEEVAADTDDNASDETVATLENTPSCDANNIAEHQTGDSEVPSLDDALPQDDVACIDEFAAQDPAGEADHALVDDTAEQDAQDAVDALADQGIADVPAVSGQEAGAASPLTNAPSQDDPLSDAVKEGWVAEKSGDSSVYRYYSKGVMQKGWLVTESNPFSLRLGLQRYWLDANGIVAINRLIDPSLAEDKDAYLAFATENAFVARGKYISESGLVYLADSDGKLTNPGWVVSRAYGDGLQRYYVEKSTHAAEPGYAKTGYAHYTTPQGYVARGKYTADNGYVYLARNNGRLEGDGWLVTGRYSQGNLQRYYIDEDAHACIPGYSTKGYPHYTTKAGNVLIVPAKESNAIRIADNNGLLADGWHVTAALGYGLQRYWQQDGKVVTNTLIETDPGVWSFARPEGFVVRGKYLYTNGRIYLADNGGKLESPGWLVTAAYDGGLQRYYISEATHAASTGFFAVEGKGYFGLLNKGYVARGQISKVAATNEGQLKYRDGWVVTDAFGQQLQRYWFKGGMPALDRLVSKDEAGYWAYATPMGYVVRGKWTSPCSGSVYLANNDGMLENPGWRVTAAYDGGLRRYRIDKDTHAATTGFFVVDDNEYYGLQDKGYVLTDHALVEGKYYDADRDGVLYPLISVSVPTKKDDVTTTQNSLVANGSVCLMLPSFAKPGKLELFASMPSGATSLSISPKGKNAFVPTNVLDLSDPSVVRDKNGAYLFDMKVGSSPVVRQVVVMLSSGIRSLFLSSVDPQQGRNYIEASPDHSAKADVCVVAVDADGGVIYNKDSKAKASKIKGRGNSTWGFGHKKPYQITLNKKADLLTTGQSTNENKKWILLANANDATQLHNMVALNLTRELTGRGIECAPVDLYYDGEYRGTYLLCEKVEIKKGRVEIFDLEEAFEDANDGVDLSKCATGSLNNAYGFEYRYVKGVADPKNITGGYLLEMDNGFYKSEPCWFNSSWGHVVVKSPEFCSSAAMRYISEKYETAIRQLDNSAIDPNKSLFDLDTFARAYLINEFTKNVDAFGSSTYLYKDKDKDRFVFEPLWDFDGSMGVRNDLGKGEFITYQGFTLPHVKNTSSLGARVTVLDNPQVRARVQKQWKETVSPLISKVLLSGDKKTVGSRGELHSAEYYRQLIDPSRHMDEVTFGIKAFRNEIVPFATYERNYRYMVDWLTWRTAWVNDNIARLNSKDVVNPPYWYDGKNLGLVFDAGYYRSKYADLAGASDDVLLWHFYNHGIPEGRVASRNFDVRSYRARYADLRAAFGNDWNKYYEHYITFGFYEGRIATS